MSAHRIIVWPMDDPMHPLVRARDFIHAHFHRPVSLDELARVTGFSRFHLVRAFAKAFGQTPHAYKLRLQVERAKALLAAGTLPAVVATETGFSDQSHFTRQFKKLVGMTPRRYAIAEWSKAAA